MTLISQPRPSGLGFSLPFDRETSACPPMHTHIRLITFPALTSPDSPKHV
jgi:hypothetical protein